MRVRSAVIAAVVALVAAGCDGDGNAPAGAESTTTTPEVTVPRDETTPPDETGSPSPHDSESPEPGATRPPSGPLTPEPSTPPPTTGEVPAQYMENVIADAIERSGAPREDVGIIRARAVRWRDGSLGCPEPGMMYTQAVVEGYWVELQVNGEVYDYRLNERGTFRLCTIPSPEPPLDFRDRS